MLETEQKIAEGMKRALPHMTEGEKERLLGFVEGLGFRCGATTEANRNIVEKGA